MTFAGVFCVCIFVACFVWALALYAYKKHKNRNLPGSSTYCRAVAIKDRVHALHTIGADSVYRFFLGTSWPGWILALATMTTQVLMLFVFVVGAEVDWTTDQTDLVYTQKCPRDQDECKNTNDLDWKGWAAFAVLMAAYLLKDIIKGAKMVVLSAKERHIRT